MRNEINCIFGAIFEIEKRLRHINEREMIDVDTKKLYIILSDFVRES